MTETLDQTLYRKFEGKYDLKLENELRSWLSELLGKDLLQEKSFQEILKDGTILCE